MSRGACDVSFGSGRTGGGRTEELAIDMRSMPVGPEQSLRGPIRACGRIGLNHDVFLGSGFEYYATAMATATGFVGKQTTKVLGPARMASGPRDCCSEVVER